MSIFAVPSQPLFWVMLMPSIIGSQTFRRRGPALQSGEIDLMNLTTTWTSNRDVNWGNFAPVMFYDGQGFMARKDSGVTSALELEDALPSA